MSFGGRRLSKSLTQKFVASRRMANFADYRLRVTAKSDVEGGAPPDLSA